MRTNGLKILSHNTKQEFLKKLPLYVLGITFFFCVASYKGIVADATLYTLQAIHSFQPERLAGDIAFLYGNQDSFTIFSPLYLIFLRIFAVETGAKIVCFLSHLFFGIATIHLIDSWTKKFHCNSYFFPITLVFMLLYFPYGETRSYYICFYYLESYLAPRIISVAFGLLGLAFIFNRKYTSLVLFFAGSLFHPLMAGWGIPIWLFYYYPKMIAPISFCSLLVPLTLFINKGPFSVYDSEWGSFFKQNLTFHFFCFIAFFIYCWKHTQKKQLQQISKALFFTVSIAVYWFIASQKTGHIFLTQVQTFRIEWICIAVTLPLFCILLYEKIITTYRKNKKIKLIDFLLFAFPIAFWIDSIFLDSLLLFVLIWAKIGLSPKSILVYRFLTIAQIICIVWMVTAVIIQQFSTYAAASYLQNFEFYPALILAILAILKYIARPTLNKLSILSLLLVFICNLTQKDLEFTENFSNAPALLSATFICTKYFSNQKFAKFAPLLWLIPFAVTHYDHRSEEQILAEKQIDYYFENPLFPEITDRGHIFFCLDGFYSTHSRIQFLSGGYFDYQSQTGSLFYREQHIQSVHRFKTLVYQDPSDTRKIIWDDFFSEFSKIHEPSSLNRTTKFLCKANEISYLVTDIPNLDFPVVNRQKKALSQDEIFLYSCNK